ncbi:neurotrimin-like isoform X1 [Lethenteron reissneri]|uniref:neurotrimin-like isoform X1 n=1 Tax=Lethenteron reissneri TaxID=7753 RepID=UPI002AB6327B|nr:neurotrimin-like isoform X1 [Lethenteron reissneri]XP_061436988.1 neurotrimin-like isoform X1 [Lethenteron reissneri]XP_061436989.1 neurotrimin-like isoform X1 [Lethenteron reissneri]XP_061436990.1 neurotrimin-like isoform X1 [Lethenteron reissneri]
MAGWRQLQVQLLLLMLMDVSGRPHPSPAPPISVWITAEIERNLVVFICTVSRNPEDAEIEFSNPHGKTYYFQNHRAYDDPRVYIIRWSYTAADLLLSQPTPRDQGHYSCSLSSPDSPRASVWLAVSAAPLSVWATGDTVSKGDTATLRCTVSDNPDSDSIQWSNPQGHTLYFESVKAHTDPRVSLLHWSSTRMDITISRVTSRDQGLYSCSLFSLGTPTAYASLTVRAAPLSVWATGDTVSEGDTATLRCTVSDNPDSDPIQWSNPHGHTLYFESVKALMDPRVSLLHWSSTRLDVTISRVSTRDQGLYSCSLFSLGTPTAYASLTVRGIYVITERRSGESIPDLKNVTEEKYTGRQTQN